MAEMSVIWLRVAAAFYSLGLLHAILTLIRRREHLDPEERRSSFQCANR